MICRRAERLSLRDWVLPCRRQNVAPSSGIETWMSSAKRLFVLRHAKSSWDNPGLDDHERPLAPRGRRALEVMSEHIRASGIAPQLVLCSTSRRTRETLEGIGVGGEHLIEPALYSATCEEVLARLRELPDDVSSAMLIGHNPTMQVLVLRLTNQDGSGWSIRVATRSSESSRRARWRRCRSSARGPTWPPVGLASRSS